MTSNQCEIVNSYVYEVLSMNDNTIVTRCAKCGYNSKGNICIVRVSPLPSDPKVSSVYPRINICMSCKVFYFYKVKRGDSLEDIVHINRNEFIRASIEQDVKDN